MVQASHKVQQPIPSPAPPCAFARQRLHRPLRNAPVSVTQRRGDCRYRLHLHRPAPSAAPLASSLPSRGAAQGCGARRFISIRPASGQVDGEADSSFRQPAGETALRDWRRGASLRRCEGRTSASVSPVSAQGVLRWGRRGSAVPGNAGGPFPSLRGAPRCRSATAAEKIGRAHV